MHSRGDNQRCFFNGNSGLVAKVNVFIQETPQSRSEIVPVLQSSPADIDPFVITADDKNNKPIETKHIYSFKQILGQKITPVMNLRPQIKSYKQIHKPIVLIQENSEPLTECIQERYPNQLFLLKKPFPHPRQDI